MLTPLIVPPGQDEPELSRFDAGLCCGDCPTDDDCTCRVTEAEDGERGCRTHMARV